jgi:DNA polymerase I-like protein with 3'-5' exonuclease and polymerase domains
MVRTLTGRRRIVTTPNQAINTPIQGSAGDITKQAMAVLSETREQSGGAYLINFCHDEFVVEIPDNPESIAAAKKWLTNAAVAGLKSVLKTVPVGISEADVKISPRWEKP